MVQEQWQQEQGSPPHVRGKVYEQMLQQAGRGITPACAGKSEYDPSAVRMAKDHPRMCGEKQLQERYGQDYQWITPACAGKRSSRWQTG